MLKTWNQVVGLNLQIHISPSIYPHPDPLPQHPDLTSCYNVVPTLWHLLDNTV